MRLCNFVQCVVVRSQVWGRIWPQISNMLVKAEVTGRNIQLEGTANSNPRIWALLTRHSKDFS